jgi:GT2 family glycosyltransferase
MPQTIDCSVVMLCHNGMQYTDYCLQSLIAANARPRELICVDNGSTDGTGELIGSMRPRLEAAGIEVITWRNAENLGCSEARNMAWEKACGHYVVFMDNDTAVCTSDWLAILAGHMEADERLGILGVKLIYPFQPHPIQCAGVDVNRAGRIRFRGRGARRDAPEFAEFAEVPVLISACWIKRNCLLEQIGGLDPLFHPIQYEDLDLCMRATAAGYKVAYTPDVEIYHFEGTTSASFGRDTYLQTIARNSLKFRQKWQATLSGYPDDQSSYDWTPIDKMGMGGAIDLELIQT